MISIAIGIIQAISKERIELESDTQINVQNKKKLSETHIILI